MMRTDAQTTFDFLERLLGPTRVRFDKSACPIGFVMLTGDQRVWNFTPRTGGPLFRPGPPVGADLYIYCHPKKLLELLTRADYVPSVEERIWTVGNPESLRAIITALRERDSPISVRVDR